LLSRVVFQVFFIVNGHEKTISLLLTWQEAMLQTFLNFVPINHENDV
jgi:hypothetical protein